MDLTTSFDFAAARRLPRLDSTHPCSRTHGHTFFVEIRLRGEIDTEYGWLLDFDQVDQVIAPLHKRLDHHYLNDIPGLENPTTEVIAIWLWQQIAPQLPQLHAIAIKEHPSRGITYFGPHSPA